MGNPAGVRRDFERLEERRFKAFGLLKKGLSEAEVARQVGVHRQSVNRWAEQIEKRGREGLKKAGRAGRKPRLKQSDLKKLEIKLKQGPQALGYETNLWTLQRVAKLIEQEMSLGDMMTLLKLRRGSHSLVSETLPPGARAVGLTIQELPLPRSSIICAVLRGSEVVIPRGNVRLEAGDDVLALVDEASAPELAALFGPPRR